MTAIDRKRSLARLGAVEERLLAHAGRELDGLTDPDPESGERWEAGHVWAHLAEFPHYWLREIERVLSGHASGAREPVPFGRTKTDAGRLAAIERDRRTAPRELMRRVEAGIGGARELMGSLQPEQWDAIGLHPTAGEMSVAAILDRFVLRHLEEHAGQLDGLRSARPPG